MAWRKENRLLYKLFLVGFFLCFTLAADSNKKKSKDSNEASEKWKKKNIRDYNDADLERLFDQWEVTSSRHNTSIITLP